MSKRETALTIIKTEWAENGKDTIHSIRAFIENRVSKQARDKAAEQGLRIFEERHGKKEEARFTHIEKLKTGKYAAWLAVFGETFALNKGSLLQRIKNLKKEGIYPVESERALTAIEEAKK